jgi:hypothetical protein
MGCLESLEEGTKYKFSMLTQKYEEHEEHEGREAEERRILSGRSSTPTCWCMTCCRAREKG